MKEILGVDIGGVIIDRVSDTNHSTIFFTDNFLQTPAVSGAIEALDQLRRERFGERMHLVSKCGLEVQNRTLKWLDHNHFYKSTGIEPERVHFCRERYEKADICKKLGITRFVDDRLEVLGYLAQVATINTRYLFRANPDEVEEFAHFLNNHILQVESWQDVLKKELVSR